MTFPNRESRPGVWDRWSRGRAGAGYRRLWAGVWDWNVASRQVLEKLGFREVGRVRPGSVYGHSLLTVREF
jgi:RimJ/RimL family protein N-acetyltransferase